MATNIQYQIVKDETKGSSFLVVLFKLSGRGFFLGAVNVTPSQCGYV